MRITGGSWRGRRIVLPKRRTLRPTSSKAREGLFSHLGDRIDQATTLDLFAGTGIVTLEAFSRGASHGVMVEKDPLWLAHLRSLVKSWNLPVKVMRGDVLKLLARWEGERFTFIFADPPYGYPAYEPLLDLCKPLVNPGGELIIEGPKPHPLSQKADQLLSYGKTQLACFFL